MSYLPMADPKQPLVRNAADTVVAGLGQTEATAKLASAEITTEQAADLLNVSVPHLVGMIEKGELPARMVRNQRRLRLPDVLAYKTENRAKRLEALREMAAIDQELGLR